MQHCNEINPHAKHGEFLLIGLIVNKMKNKYYSF